MSAPDNLTYEFGPFLLEPRARRLSRGGESVRLAAPEFEILLLLVLNHGRVVEKREIMASVWPDAVVEENNLTVRMSSLRRALGERKGYHPYIQTVTGRGYCLVSHVKELPAQPGTGMTETAPATLGVPESPTGPDGDPRARGAQSTPLESADARRRPTFTPPAAHRTWAIRGFRLALPEKSLRGE